MLLMLLCALECGRVMTSLIESNGRNRANLSHIGLDTKALERADVPSLGCDTVDRDMCCALSDLSMLLLHSLDFVDTVVALKCWCGALERWFEGEMCTQQLLVLPLSELASRQVVRSARDR